MIRKRIVPLCLVLCLLLGVSACGQTAAFDEEALTQAALTAEQQLRSGDYASVYDSFDAAMRSAMSQEDLQTTWEAAMAAVGAYVEQISASGSESGKYYSVDVVSRYEKRSLNVRFTFDSKGQLAGLHTSYVDLPEESDTWTEAAVTVAAEEAYPLSGLLTLPKDVETPPVVILVQGSGPSDKNETVGAAGNAPFRDLAHGLAEQGIAVLRYDKRTYSYPAAFSDPASITIQQETLDDVEAAIALMQADSRVDGSRIYVLGHSLGGMLVPKLAAEHPELTGVISMAGSLRQLWQISYDQNMEALDALGEVPEAQQPLLEQQLEQLEADYAQLEKGAYSTLADDETLMGLPVGYWRSLADANGMKYVGQISQPMLILQGSADFQVYPDKDYTLWQEVLGSRDNVTFRLYEGLNHLMMPTSGLRSTADYDKENHVSQDVIDDIAAFVKA